jgi:CRISPR-associated endonuclease Csn1
MHYRLGLDIGANSIGWCVLSLDEDNTPSAIVRMGVRIFSDGRNSKDGSSLATTRRLKRQMRRMRDRYVLRRDRLMQQLIRHGLMPPDETARKALQEMDPYALRAVGLHAQLPMHHLGRAIFHLNQRRGFKSNRKADRDIKEVGPIKSGVEKLRQVMAEDGTPTLGAFLHQRRIEGLTVRSRLQKHKSKSSYDFYPDRALLEEEFDLLWQAQSKFHPQLTPAMRDDIEKELFFQRPLKPVEPGKCTFLPHEPRTPWALPLTQRFRILQELGNLVIIGPDYSQRPLTPVERDALLAKLMEQKTEVDPFVQTKMSRV